MKIFLKFFAAVLLFSLGTTLHAQCFDMSMESTDYSDKTCIEMNVSFETNLTLAGGVRIFDNKGNESTCLSAPCTVTWCYDKRPISQFVRIQCISQEREITLPNGNNVAVGCNQRDGCVVTIGPE